MEFFTTNSVLLLKIIGASMAVLIALIILLSHSERKLKQTVIEQKEEERTYFEREATRLLTSADPPSQRFIQLDQLTRSFLQDKFGFQNADYSHIHELLRTKEEKQLASFVYEMLQVLYSGEQISKERVHALILDFRKVAQHHANVPSKSAASPSPLRMPLSKPLPPIKTPSLPSPQDPVSTSLLRPTAPSLSPKSPPAPPQYTPNTPTLLSTQQPPKPSPSPVPFSLPVTPVQPTLPQPQKAQPSTHLSTTPPPPSAPPKVSVQPSRPPVDQPPTPPHPERYPHGERERKRFLKSVSNDETERAEIRRLEKELQDLTPLLPSKSKKPKKHASSKRKKK